LGKKRVGKKVQLHPKNRGGGGGKGKTWERRVQVLARWGFQGQTEKNTPWKKDESEVDENSGTGRERTSLAKRNPKSVQCNSTKKKKETKPRLEKGEERSKGGAPEWKKRVGEE